MEPVEPSKPVKRALILASDNTFERVEESNPELIGKWVEDIRQAEDERLTQMWVRRCDRKLRRQNYRRWKSLQDLPIKARVIKMYSEKWG